MMRFNGLDPKTLRAIARKLHDDMRDMADARRRASSPAAMDHFNGQWHALHRWAGRLRKEAERIRWRRQAPFFVAAAAVRVAAGKRRPKT